MPGSGCEVTPGEGLRRISGPRGTASRGSERDDHVEPPGSSLSRVSEGGAGRCKGLGREGPGGCGARSTVHRAWARGHGK